MRRLRASITLFFLALAAACAPDVQPTLHDIVLYGLDAGGARYSVFYGAPTAFELEGETVELTEGRPEGALAVRGSLLVDGQPHRTSTVEPIDPPIQASRIPLTTSLQVRAEAGLGAVVYYDGSAWLTLLDPSAGAVDRRVAPRPRIGKLRGVGALTPDEADAVASFLEARGEPVVVAALGDDRVPERTIDGLAEYRATALYVQTALGVDSSAYQAPPEELVWEVIARGTQAVGFEEPAFRLVRDENELLALWNQAWGGQLEVPPVPDVSFSRETIVAVFQGQKPTGGYGIEVLDVIADDREVFVDLRFLEPGPEDVVTQSLTSPWVMVRVLRGGIQVAWFRNPDTGELLGVARRD